MQLTRRDLINGEEDADPPNTIRNSCFILLPKKPAKTFLEQMKLFCFSKIYIKLISIQIQ